MLSVLPLPPSNLLDTTYDNRLHLHQNSSLFILKSKSFADNENSSKNTNLSCAFEHKITWEQRSRVATEAAHLNLPCSFSTWAFELQIYLILIFFFSDLLVETPQ